MNMQCYGDEGQLPPGGKIGMKIEPDKYDKNGMLIRRKPTTFEILSHPGFISIGIVAVLGLSMLRKRK